MWIRWGMPLLPIASMVLLATAFPPWNVTWLAWIGLAPLAMLFRARQAGRGVYLSAALAGPLFYLVVLDWIRTSYGATGFSGPKVIPWLIIGTLALPSMPLVIWIGRRALLNSRLPMAIGLPIVWVAFEYARMHYGATIQGAPFVWAQLAHTQTGHLRLIQLADIGGAWIITGAIAISSGLICDLIESARGAGSRQAMLCSISFTATLVVAVFGYSWWRLEQKVCEEGPRVTLMPPESANELLSAAEPQSLGESFPKAEPELRVWSELVLEYPLTPASTGRLVSTELPQQDLRDALCSYAARNQTAIVVGLPRVDESGRRYNSLAVVNPWKGACACYDKQAIVPWSETLPWWASPFLNDHSSRFTAGEHQPVFELFSPADRRYCFAAAICYDICFPEVMRGYLPNEPDFYIVPACESADQTGAVAESMLAMTRLRAVECRRAIVRNVEGGHSCLIDGNGAIHKRAPSPRLQHPYLLSAVPVDRRFGLYRYCGDCFPITCLVTLVWLCRPRSRIPGRIRSAP